MAILITTLVACGVGAILYIAYCGWRNWLTMYQLLIREIDGVHTQLRIARCQLSETRRELDDIKARIARASSNRSTEESQQNNERHNASQS